MLMQGGVACNKAEIKISCNDCETRKEGEEGEEELCRPERKEDRRRGAAGYLFISLLCVPGASSAPERVGPRPSPTQKNE
jgi:hypothetical protein